LFAGIIDGIKETFLGDHHAADLADAGDQVLE
jgi:hypothetical protein